MQIEGLGFVRRLEALRHHFKLNPPDLDEAAEALNSADVIRTVGSDGLK